MMRHELRHSHPHDPRTGIDEAAPAAARVYTYSCAMPLAGGCVKLHRDNLQESMPKCSLDAAVLVHRRLRLFVER